MMSGTVARPEIMALGKPNEILIRGTHINAHMRRTGYRRWRITRLAEVFFCWRAEIPKNEISRDIPT